MGSGNKVWLTNENQRSLVSYTAATCRIFFNPDGSKIRYLGICKAEGFLPDETLGRKLERLYEDWETKAEMMGLMVDGHVFAYVLLHMKKLTTRFIQFLAIFRRVVFCDMSLGGRELARGLVGLGRFGDVVL